MLAATETVRVEVAEILHEAMAGKNKTQVKKRVRELRREFQTVGYSFGRSPAYLFN